VVVQQKGCSKSLSKFEVGCKQLANQVASGNLRAFKLMKELMESIDQLALAPTNTPGVENEEDFKQRLIDRVEKLAKRHAELAQDQQNGGGVPSA
jgi:hypothetical protein